MKQYYDIYHKGDKLLSIYASNTRQAIRRTMETLRREGRWSIRAQDLDAYIELKGPAQTINRARQ